MVCAMANVMARREGRSVRRRTDREPRWCECCRTMTAPSSPLVPDAPIDPEMLGEIYGDDTIALAEFLGRFQSFNAADVSALRHAVAALDMAEVVHASHRMKGAAATVGAGALAAVCARIEMAARENQPLATITPEMALLDHELERLDRHVRQLRESYTAIGAKSSTTGQR